jgi:hypothetical protein
MSTPTITEFLEARIAEDEQVAGPEYGWESADARIREWESDHRSGLEISAPRLRAECAAKRKIVQYAEGLRLDLSRDAETDAQYRAVWWILWQLATPYSDHPDYRQEWAL